MERKMEVQFPDGQILAGDGGGCGGGGEEEEGKSKGIRKD